MKFTLSVYLTLASLYFSYWHNFVPLYYNNYIRLGGRFELLFLVLLQSVLS